MQRGEGQGGVSRRRRLTEAADGVGRSDGEGRATGFGKREMGERKASSIIHQGEEFHTPAALSDPTNVIGILGGDSSLIFAKKLVDHETELPFILCMEPALSNERLLLQKGPFRCLSGKPFIHMGESVAEELKEAKLRPIEAGSALSIGVLATNSSLVTRMYQQKLENEGFEVLIPDSNTLKHIVMPAVEALSQKDFVGATNLLRISLHILLVRAVNRIVLASDELRELLPSDDPLWRKCIDPMDALARSTVKYAQSAERRSK